MVRSKYDPNHITQIVFDEESRANRVKLVDTQISIEVRAEDGDSITSHPVKLTISSLGCTSDDIGKEIVPPMDCSSLRELHASIEGTGQVLILASPMAIGDFFYEVGSANQIHKICAKRIKVKSIDAIGNVHLVGRS